MTTQKHTDLLPDEYVETEKGHKFTQKEYERRENFANYLCKRFDPVFRHLGYGLARLGSNVRDIDIIAVPWCKPMPLATADLFVMELVCRFDLQMGNRGETLNGHRWYALWHKEHPTQQIDLKVMLPADTRKADCHEELVAQDGVDALVDAMHLAIYPNYCTITQDYSSSSFHEGFKRDLEIGLRAILSCAATHQGDGK